jgi:hypothetical protein
MLSYVESCALVAVLPGPDKLSRPHSPKTTAIFEAFLATYIPKNLLLHDISKHNDNKKQKNIIFGEGFCSFFSFCSPFLD